MRPHRLVFLLILLLALTPLRSHAGSTLIVSPEGPYTTILEALGAAENGDTIEVHGGIYPALTIDKSVTLIGIDQPIIDAESLENVVIVAAPQVTIQGFTIRNSGTTVYHEYAGILIQAAEATITDNQLENVLFGIKIMNAPRTVVQGNTIRGQDHEMGLRGDSVTVWYSDDVRLTDNHITHTRDMLISYANGIHIENNTIEDSRYGLHFMYSDNVFVRGNRLQNNSVGAFLMYSANLTVQQNTFAYNQGSSGYGLALKDMDGVVVEDNLLVGNTTGLYLDNSPSLYEGYNTFTGNVFAYNNVGVAALPAVERNLFQRNTFLKNLQQVGVNGREMTSRNLWSQDGVGNYWSDYVGYDRDGDGAGDIIYRSDKLFQSLANRYPVIKLFQFSPAAQAIEFTGSAFPVLRPTPLVIDDAPLMNYRLPAFLGENRVEFSRPFLGLAMALFGIPLAILAFAFYQPSPHHKKTITALGGRMIVVEHLTKQYGSTAVLSDLTFRVETGEAVALWGTNGAGKTTTLRCLLGVHPFEGSIAVNGIDVSRNSKATRAVIGYVPQELTFYDMTVLETLKFYARLKKAPTAPLTEILRRVGLEDQQKKAVRALSGGMRQRLALAISLIGDPPILLLDESTANLDAEVRREFLQLVLSLKDAGKTIVFCTHRLEEVVMLADRVLVLKEGRIEADCPVTELPEKLGMQQWLRIWVPQEQTQTALDLLQHQGYRPVMNSHTFYINVGLGNKMAPLRMLEAAQILVEDFEIVDAIQGDQHDR
jgi:nitrous oxidase accessory protein